jgi:hypothetical protein
VNTTHYTASREIRKAGWTGLAITPLLALGSGALLSLRQFTLNHLIIGTVLSFVVTVPVMLWVIGRYLGTTTTNGQGIRLRGTFVRGSVPWGEVASIEIADLEARGSHTYMIQVGRHRGRPVNLPGLASTTREDPKLVGDLEAIRADWETANGRIDARCDL